MQRWEEVPRGMHDKGREDLCQEDVVAGRRGGGVLGVGVRCGFERVRPG